MLGMSSMTYQFWKLDQVAARSIASGRRHLPHQPPKYPQKNPWFKTQSYFANPVKLQLSDLWVKIPILLTWSGPVEIMFGTATVRGTKCSDQKMFGRIRLWTCEKNAAMQCNSLHALEGLLVQRLSCQRNLSIYFAYMYNHLGIAIYIG